MRKAGPTIAFIYVLIKVIKTRVDFHYFRRLYHY